MCKIYINSIRSQQQQGGEADRRKPSHSYTNIDLSMIYKKGNKNSSLEMNSYNLSLSNPKKKQSIE